MLRTLLAVILALAVAGANAQIVDRPVAASAISNPGTSLPASCAVGYVYFKSDSAAGQNLHLCASANTWTQMSGGNLTNPVGAAQGGTGIANNAAATLTRTGSHALTLTTSGTTSLTLPTAGTVAVTTDITGGSLAGSFTTLATSSTITAGGAVSAGANEFKTTNGGPNLPAAGAGSWSSTTASGAIVIGQGTSRDVSLMNRAGSVAFGVVANSQNVLALAALGVTNHITTTTPNTRSSGSYSVLDTDNWIINNNAGTLTLTFQAASSYTGRAITVKTTTANTVVSASSNVVPCAGGAASTPILAATAGKFATLVSDGTNWVIMACN